MAGKKATKIGKKREAAVLTERKKLTASEQIRQLEEEIGKTKYNKKTQHAIGLMKAKLAMLKERALARSAAGKARGDERFSIRKTGDGTAVLLGFPSVGKSTLLNKITNAKSEVAAYDFTTLSAVPGLMEYNHAKIQIIDVPGIVSGAAAGRGRGKEVLQMIRNADIILILVDAMHPEHYGAMLKEIYETGVRINQKAPDVKIRKKERGGIGVGVTVKLTKIDKHTIADIAREMRLNNADILVRDDIDTDQLIDIIEGNKRYTKALTVVTKIDLIDEMRLKKIQEEVKPDVVVSAELGFGIEELKKAIFDRMGFIRIFLKEISKQADLEEPLIMFKECIIRDVCEKLHKDFVDKFKFARVWGKSAKFGGQRVGIGHRLEDDDIVELHLK